MNNGSPTHFTGELMAIIEVLGALACVRNLDFPLARDMAGRRKLIAPRPALTTQTCTQP